MSAALAGFTLGMCGRDAADREDCYVKANILLVEDDVATARVLSAALATFGYSVRAVECGDDAKTVIRQMRPDLIILDLILPDTDGLVLTPILRSLSSAPIIVCSARQEQADRVLGLKLGADAFVSKPFDLDELEARIEAVLRRAARAPQPPPPPGPDQICVGPLTIALAAKTVTLDGQPVHLTPTEYRLLLALASRPGKVVSRDALAQLLSDRQRTGTSHQVEVHMGRLRAKLRRAARSEPVIITVWGQGYAVSPRPTNPEGGGSGQPPASAAVQRVRDQRPRAAGSALGQARRPGVLQRAPADRLRVRVGCH